MKVIFASLIVLIFVGCSASSPRHAYAIKTVEYGQCKSLKKTHYKYKGEHAKYICADNIVLLGEPYRTQGKWYFKSGHLEGKKVKDIFAVEVYSAIKNRCHLEGEYGSGSGQLKKFYFDLSLKMCKPFTWSGEGGTAPFDSIDECEMKCAY